MTSRSHSSRSSRSTTRVGRESDTSERSAQTAATGGLPWFIRGAVQSRGERLDDTMRSKLEPLFGYDLSHVEVHAGSKAIAPGRNHPLRATTTAPLGVPGLEYSQVDGRLRILKRSRDHRERFEGGPDSHLSAGLRV